MSLFIEVCIILVTLWCIYDYYTDDTETGVEGDEESNPTPSIPNPPLTLNRATRRQMAKILRHHPDHKGITHASLPLECSELEYLYWQMCISEVELDKNKKQDGEV